LVLSWEVGHWIGNICLISLLRDTGSDQGDSLIEAKMAGLRLRERESLDRVTAGVALVYRQWLINM